MILFQNVLQEIWQDLPEKVREAHTFQNTQTFTGTAEVERGNGLISKLTGWIFGFPNAQKEIPVTVVKTRTTKGEIWQRKFGKNSFKSRLQKSKRPHSFIERFGLVSFEIKLSVADNSLHFPVSRAWLLGIPLPALLLPKSNSREYEKDGVFHFDVRLSAPIWNSLIIRYSGSLQSD